MWMGGGFMIILLLAVVCAVEVFGNAIDATNPESQRQKICTMIALHRLMFEVLISGSLIGYRPTVQVNEDQVFL